MNAPEEHSPLDPKLVSEVEDLLEQLGVDFRLDAGEVRLTQEELEQDLRYGRAS